MWRPDLYFNFYMWVCDLETFWFLPPREIQPWLVASSDSSNICGWIQQKVSADGKAGQRLPVYPLLQRTSDTRPTHAVSPRAEFQGAFWSTLQGQDEGVLLCWQKSFSSLEIFMGCNPLCVKTTLNHDWFTWGLHNIIWADSSSQPLLFTIEGIPNTHLSVVPFLSLWEISEVCLSTWGGHSCITGAVLLLFLPMNSEAHNCIWKLSLVWVTEN